MPSTAGQSRLLAAPTSAQPQPQAAPENYEERCFSCPSTPAVRFPGARACFLRKQEGGSWRVCRGSPRASATASEEPPPRSSPDSRLLRVRAQMPPTPQLDSVAYLASPAYINSAVGAGGSHRKQYFCEESKNHFKYPNPCMSFYSADKTGTPRIVSKINLVPSPERN